MNKSDLKYILRNTFGISKVYNTALNLFKKNKFKCDSIKRINYKIVDDDCTRINIFFPAFEADFVYGGITTALKVLYGIADNLQSKIRIVVLNGQFSKKSTYKAPKITYSKNSMDLFFLEDGRELEIGINDFLIGTFWNTVPSITNILEAQTRRFELINRKFIYLIQDYEPGFYNWSTEYILSECTYTQNPNNIYAVFNTSLLQNYFHNHGYHFGEEIYFEPEINDKLKKELLSIESTKRREKIIIIYGRPRIDRNVFEIIRYALSRWSSEYKCASEWRIYSLGTDISNIHLKNNVIESKGKLPIEEYAKLMARSYAGISLMVSPHPSYPPLEMSTFGVRTITNRFENKNLVGFNENIISINSCDPKLIFDELCTVCDEFDSHNSNFAINKEYFEGGSFDKTIKELTAYVKGEIINGITE